MNRRGFMFLAAGAAVREDKFYSTLPQLIETNKIPGTALAVFRDGKVDFRRCFGVCEGAGGRPVDADTVFEAASLSKPVFATVVLRLAERGEFDLDKPLLEYLGGNYTHVQEPWNPNSAKDELTDPRAAQLTGRLVLSHRTGLPNWRFGRRLEFIRNPGDWGYSGEGYVMLQHAVEKKTGKDLSSLADDGVLETLKLKRTRFVWHDSLLPNVARGHNADGSVRRVTGLAFAVSAGSLVTTLNDYARFVEATLRRKPALLGAKMQETMLTAVSSSESAGLRWGLGWGLPLYDEPYLFHWGSNPGYKSFVLASLKSGRGVVFFTNSEHGLKILPQIVPAVFGKELPLTKWRMLQ
jgi:CubicO group peptidase (beta-lactamase class C family)